MQRELLDQLITAIGSRIVGIGEDIEDSKFQGLGQKLNELRTLIESAEAAERMRGL